MASTISAGLRAYLEVSFPQDTTPRAKQERYYLVTAIGALGNGENKAFDWLVSEADAEAMKRSVLQALGRIEDPESLRKAATVICKEKPSAKKAVAMIRGWRRGKKLPPGDVDYLTKAITRAINNYLATHACTWEQVKKALKIADFAIKAAAEEEEG